MSRHVLVKGAAPSLPAAGKISVYFNSASGRLELKDGDTGQTYPLQAAEFDKNLLINGGFDLAQRQAPGTLTSYATSANRQYAADRWAMMVQTSSLQYQRVDSIGAIETNLFARMYGKYKQVTGAGKAVIFQWVESSSMASLRGRNVRLQVKLKRTVAAAMVIRLGLVQNQAAGTADVPTVAFVSAYGANGVDPTLGASIAYIAPVANTAIGGTISGSLVTCTLTGAWINFGAVFTVPTDAKNIAPVIITDSQLAINDELNVAEAGLFDGPDVMDWVPQPFANEVDRCQRFYCKSFDLDTAPAQNAGLGGSERYSIVIAGAVATSWIGKEILFPIRMRIVPTLTFYNPSAANAFVRNITLATDATATAGANTSTQRSHVSCTGLAAWVVANDSAVHFSADAEI